MILGMSTATYTLLHVLISLAGIGTGLIVTYGLITARRFDGWTAIFLFTTALTSITGFGFPTVPGSPAIVVGIISLVLLALAIPARYIFRLTGSWRWIYIISAMMALYLNVFVLVVQLFEKVPVLNALAPTQKESPFLVAQSVVLTLFVWLTYRGMKAFHLNPARTA